MSGVVKGGWLTGGIVGRLNAHSSLNSHQVVVARHNFNKYWSEKITSDSNLQFDPIQHDAAKRIQEAHKKWSQSGRSRNGSGGGVYIYGPVGQGKTLLMKSLGEYIQKFNSNRMLKCHYADFMLMINAMLRSSTLRELEPEQILLSPKTNPGLAVYLAGDEGLDFICKKLEPYTHLLIDEININNISDALLFRRVLTRLWQNKKMFTVMTSNVAPQRLYEGGLNRSQFIGFIPLMESICATVHLNAKHDYRLDDKEEVQGGGGGAGAEMMGFNVPSPPRYELVCKLLKARGGQTGVKVPLLHGREINCAWLSSSGDEALISFTDLCQSNSGPSDYISLAAQISKKIIICDIPTLHVEFDGDVIRRFITLIDVFYERQIPIVYYSAAPPLKLIEGVADEQLSALKTFDAYLNNHNLTCATWWHMNVDKVEELVGLPAWLSITSGVLTPALAEALWHCKKLETMTLSNLQGLIAYYRMYGTVNGDLGEISRALISQFGDQLIKPPSTSSPINVKYAVPRLVSRMVEAFGT